MELIKGRSTGRADRQTEQVFRVPAKEDIWEVSCSDEVECEEREVQTVRKRPDFPIVVGAF